MLGASRRWLEAQLGTRKKAKACQNLQRHIPQVAWTLLGFQTPSKDHKTEGHHVHTGNCEACECTHHWFCTHLRPCHQGHFATCIPPYTGLPLFPDKEQPLYSDHSYHCYKPPEQPSLQFCLSLLWGKTFIVVLQVTKHILENYWGWRGMGKRVKSKSVAPRARRDCTALSGQPARNIWLFPAVLRLTFLIN